MESVVGFLCDIVFFFVFRLFGLGEQINLPIAIALLLFGYIFVMIRLNFIQFTKFGKCLSLTFGRPKGKNKKEKQVSSPLKTLLTSIASCTGMNATAGIVFMIFAGGVGTVFWIPFIAFGCMAFRFAEVYLSHHYRAEKIDNNAIGGPFDYIKKGLAEIKIGKFKFNKIGKRLAVLYAFVMVVAGVFGVSMYEMNQSVVVLERGFSFLEGKRVLLSCIFTIIALFVILGGTKRVANFMSVALPTLSISYLTISIVVIAYNYQMLPDAFIAIYQDAIHPKAIAGGFLASFCMCARKCALSHETGLGTSGIVHALSSEKDSIKEATRAMMTPLITGLIICMATALVLITTGVYNNPEVMKDGVPALTEAFGGVCWLFAYLIIIIIPMFTINVMIGWSNYCVKCIKYIKNNKQITSIALFLFFICAFTGGIIDDFALIMNLVDALLMVILIINVPIVMLLSGKVKQAVKEYNFKKA